MTRRETTVLAMVLVLLAVGLHTGHYLIFRDARDLFFYLGLDIAFLPVSLLVLTLLVDRLLSERERAERRHKMNMVIGVFFSELGRPLLRMLRGLHREGAACLSAFQLQPETSEASLRKLALELSHTDLDIALTPEAMEALRELLKQHEELTLRLLANPTLLEHESFTDVLWAVVHLGEELAAREDFRTLPESDVAHLEGDVQRVYNRLLAQWLAYLVHLQRLYPYLYSFAVRADPLQEGGRVEVVEGR